MTETAGSAGSAGAQATKSANSAMTAKSATASQTTKAASAQAVAATKTAPSSKASKPEQGLDDRALNRALLARQGLLEPFDLPIAETVERIGAVQSQYWPAPPVALFSRMRRSAGTRCTPRSARAIWSTAS